MKTIKQISKTFTASQKATIFYLFIKLAKAKNQTKLPLYFQRDYKAAFESKKHKAVIEGQLIKRLTASFVLKEFKDGDQVFVTSNLTYKYITNALRADAAWVGRQQNTFNRVVKAGIDWEMYADVVNGKIKDSAGHRINNVLDYYTYYINAKRELSELDAAMGTGRYSHFSNKPKLPQAVRTAVKHRRGSLEYTLDSWKDYAGLLDGNATAEDVTGRNGVDWASFENNGPQEYVYKCALPLT